MDAAAQVHRKEASKGAQVRHYWNVERVKALYDLPFADLMFQAQRAHRKHFDPNHVETASLLSIKTGGCPEDCGYCSQSAHYETGLEATRLMHCADVVASARRAKDAGATRFCMTVDLNLPIEIVTVPTVREPDGLAMSSRNRYLSREERGRSLAISRGLFAAAQEFASGERDAATLIALATKHLELIDRLQYLELVDARTLSIAESPLRYPAVLCVAAYVGSTRLIDNVVLS